MSFLSLYELSLLFISLHFIGDFAFQSAWMAMEKGKSFEVLIYHCLTYTAPFAVTVALLGGLTPYTPHTLSVPIILGTHVVIDTCSARLKLMNIWQDQLCHLIVIAALIAVDWL